MQALKLSEMYYHDTCVPMLNRYFSDFINDISAGLVGEGSECFGFDDAISRDHDWGAAICFWLNKKSYEKFGEKLKVKLEELPKSIAGYPVRTPGKWSAGRTGVLEIEHFYYRYIGHKKAPETSLDWLKIPESSLATATNGKVFSDPSGEFTKIRNELLDFYPESVRRKKIAARCAKIAQAGQYNFPRCLQRNELVAATMAEAEFIDAVCSLTFLLNKKYKPFYKWAHKALYSLPILGSKIATLLNDLVTNTSNNNKVNLIEEISGLLIKELYTQALSDSTSDFLLEHAVCVQNTVQDTTLKNIDVFLG